MRVVFFGSSHGFPEAGRRCSSIFLQVGENNYFIDMGTMAEEGLRNRGIVYRPGLYVLRETSMPSVLVEMGFISNPYDAELLAYSPNLFALGIYRGILEYYGF